MIFYHRFYPLQLFSYLNSWERASIFPFECSVLNKGTNWYHFITSLVWRGPWLEIEPGTSRTQSQHSTTRLSRRRLQIIEYAQYIEDRCILSAKDPAIFQRVLTTVIIYFTCGCNKNPCIRTTRAISSIV